MCVRGKEREYIVPPPCSVLELDQGLREKGEKYEKEKHTLLEQNKQLKQELDNVSILLYTVLTMHCANYTLC